MQSTRVGGSCTLVCSLTADQALAGPRIRRRNRAFHLWRRWSASCAASPSTQNTIQSSSLSIALRPSGRSSHSLSLRHSFPASSSFAETKQRRFVPFKYVAVPPLLELKPCFHLQCHHEDQHHTTAYFRCPVHRLADKGSSTTDRLRFY